MCAGLPAWIVRLCAWLVSRTSATRIREDDVCVFLPLPYLCSDSLQEIPIATPTLFPRWGIYDRGRSAERLGLGRFEIALVLLFNDIEVLSDRFF